MLLYGITTLTEDINNKHCLTLVFVISVEHDNVELSSYVCCVLRNKQGGRPPAGLISPMAISPDGW